jgi:PST family polysaccharide transporter
MTEVRRNVPWTLLTYVMNRGITLAVTIILARLLSPADFGLVALALTIMFIFNIASGLGLANVLITERDLDKRVAGTLLTMMVVSGAIVALVVVAVAPAMAALFDEPNLEDVLAAVAPIILITSFTWFYDSLLQLELRFARRLVASITENAVYAAVALGLAIGGAGYWSLVGGQLAGATAAATAFAVLATIRPRPAFHAKIARRAVSSGSGFLLQTGFGFVQQNADFIIVGKMLGPTPLGLYSAAYRIGDLPYSAIAGKAVGENFVRATRIVIFVSAPIGILVSATAHPFVETILGEKWLPMAPALAIFGIWAVMRSIEGSMAWFLNSLGQARVVGIVSAALVAPLVAGIVLAALVGITAVAAVILAHTLVLLGVLAVAIERHAGVTVTAQLLAARGILVASAVAWLVAASISRGSESTLSPIVALLLGAFLGLLAYVIVIQLLDGQLLRDSLAQLRQIRGKVSRTPPEPLAEPGADTESGRVHAQRTT